MNEGFNWIDDVIGGFAGFNQTQMQQLEAAMPHFKNIVDELIDARPTIQQLIPLANQSIPLIQQAAPLVAKILPDVQGALNEWKIAGPALSMVLAVLGPKINAGQSSQDALLELQQMLKGVAP